MTLDEIKARLAAATPGPWDIDGPWWHDTSELRCEATVMVTAGEERRAVAIDIPSWVDKAEGDNMTLIAHAPDDIAWLIAEVERLTPSPEFKCDRCGHLNSVHGTDEDGTRWCDGGVVPGAACYLRCDVPTTKADQ